MQMTSFRRQQKVPCHTKSTFVKKNNKRLVLMCKTTTLHDVHGTFSLDPLHNSEHKKLDISHSRPQSPSLVTNSAE